MNCLRLAVLVLLPIAPSFAQTTPSPQVGDDANRPVLEGTQLLTSGDIDAALESFRKARQIAPDNIEAVVGLARTESLKPELHAQAQADYEAALSIRPTADLYAELALALFSAKDFPAAITSSKKALSLNPELLAAEMVYGNALSEIGDFDGAINVFSKACVQSRTADPQTNGNCGVWQVIPFLPGTAASIASARAWAYFKKGDCPSLALAEKDFIEAVSFEPNNPNLHDRLGTVLMGEGSTDLANCARNQSERADYLDRAWYQFRAAMNLDSKNPLYRGGFVALSEVLKRKPEYEGGIAAEPSKSELEQFLSEHSMTGSGRSSNSLQSLESLADNALDAERDKRVADTQDAVTDAMEAIRAQPTDGFAWGKLGHAYFDLGDYKNAEEATKKAVEIFSERFKNAPPPVESDEASTDLGMLGVYNEQLAEISEKLHKRRQATRYRDLALRALDLQRALQSSSPVPPSSGAAQQRTFRVEQRGGNGGHPAQTKPLPLNPPPPCPLPVHETCQMPSFNPQPYDPNNPQPYRAPDTRAYDHCLLGNQREDARYQQCLQQRQSQQQRDRQNH